MTETSLHKSINVPINGIFLPGEIDLPDHSSSIVIFSHGSGSSRLSRRNQLVAKHLRNKGIGTFLFDLLTKDEDKVYFTRFDIELLTDRLIFATNWLLNQPYAQDLSVGYFGASTGGASALHAAAQLGDKVSAVVSRGGRPDLAGPAISKVKAPTLLIVGSLDYEVLELNEQAFKLLQGPKEFMIVKGASHLFEETGKLEEVSEHAAHWFSRYLLESVV